MSSITKLYKPPVDFFITLFLWFYFIFGYIFFYLPVLLLLSPFIGNRETKFQNMNHYFYRVFFWMLNVLTPGLSITIGKEVKKIRSSVVIANHRSYLDPILLISMYPKHKTFVKGIFFKIPIMRWVMKSGGYIPFMPRGEYSDYIEESIKNMAGFLKSGGNLFIFPEGRRSRDGSLGKFQKGAFTIACNNRVPLHVIYINNTDRLFTPGKFFFNTCIKNTISVDLLGSLDPSKNTALEMREKAIMLYKNRMKENNLKNTLSR